LNLSKPSYMTASPPWPQQASLQLLEATNISPIIGRLRRHPNPTLALKAEQLALRWNAVAAATLVHAQRHIQDTPGTVGRLTASTTL